MPYINRDIEPVIRKLVKTFSVVAVTGSRQTGKTTLLQNLFIKTHRIISFDDPIILDRAKNDPKLFLSTLKEDIIFDEIQYIPELLRYIKIEVDKNRSHKGKFILTGSQQFMMMKDISETLAGRIAIVNLFPFTLAEKSKLISFRDKKESTEDVFVEAGMRGSYPETNVDLDLDPLSWKANYIKTYLERDVRTLYNVGKLSEFRRFLGFLANHISQILNLSTYARELSVSVNTIKSWISILEASGLIYLLQPYYNNLNKRITKNPKLYFTDIGLATYLAGIRSKEHIFYGPLAGALFENFVIQEVIKFFTNKGIDPLIYYIRTLNKLELDLIVEHDLKLYPFEIKLSKSPTSKMVRNIEFIKKSFPNLKFEEGALICLSDEKAKLTKDINIFNITSFLNFMNRRINF